MLSTVSYESFTVTDSPEGVLPITLTDATGTMYANVGEYYPTVDSAWQNYTTTYGEVYGVDFDESVTISGGGQIECFETYAGSNVIRCNFTAGLTPGQEIVFVLGSLGGIVNNQIYYVLDVIDTTNFTITDTPGGITPVSLSSDTGLMYGDFANQRMAIYTISVDPLTSIVSLSLTTQTHEYEYVQVIRGNYYRSAYLYYPGAPAQGNLRVDWEPLNEQETAQTTFDQNSMQFVDPVDMYDPGETFDKYLVFPKSNILV